jgi:hypothetical protein
MSEAVVPPPASTTEEDDLKGVDRAIIDALDSPKTRAFLLELEQDLLGFSP